MHLGARRGVCASRLDWADSRHGRGGGECAGGRGVAQLHDGRLDSGGGLRHPRQVELLLPPLRSVHLPSLSSAPLTPRCAVCSGQRHESIVSVGSSSVPKSSRSSMGSIQSTDSDRVAARKPPPMHLPSESAMAALFSIFLLSSERLFDRLSTHAHLAHLDTTDEPREVVVGSSYLNALGKDVLATLVVLLERQAATLNAVFAKLLPESFAAVHAKHALSLLSNTLVAQFRTEIELNAGRLELGSADAQTLLPLLTAIEWLLEANGVEMVGVPLLQTSAVHGMFDKWLTLQRHNFHQVLRRSVEQERWVPETSTHSISSSVIDFFQCLWQIVSFFLSVVQVPLAVLPLPTPRCGVAAHARSAPPRPRTHVASRASQGHVRAIPNLCRSTSRHPDPLPLHHSLPLAAAFPRDAHPRRADARRDSARRDGVRRHRLRPMRLQRRHHNPHVYGSARQAAAGAAKGGSRPPPRPNARHAEHDAEQHLGVR